MTEEQIKQNAEEYAKRNEQTLVNKDSDGYLMTDYPALVECYIAGAHSRDEEFEQLERFLKMSSDTTDEMTRYIIKLREEIEKLKEE